MEFLGDSIMQLVATEYLFIHFPDHHEGHLTVRSNHLNHKSAHTVLTESPPAHRHVHFTSTSASLHLRFVFIMYFCFCCLKLKTAVLYFFFFFFLYMKWSYSCAFVSVCGWFFFFLPSFPSFCASQVFTPFLFCLFPQNNSLPLFTSHCACMFTVLLVMGIVMRQNCSVFFFFFFLLTHLCWHIFAETVSSLKNKVVRVCCKLAWLVTQVQSKWSHFEHEVHFLTASNGITTPFFHLSISTSLQKTTWGWRDQTGLKLNKYFCS